MELKPGERIATGKSSRQSLTATPSRDGSPGAVEETGRRTVPERIRQKKKDYSPEVVKSKPSPAVGIKLKPGHRKSTATPAETPPPELGKRAPRPSARYSPTSATKKLRASHSKTPTEEPPIIKKFLLSTFKEAFYVGGEIPQSDYSLPPRILNLWKKKRAAEEAAKPSKPAQPAASSPAEHEFAIPVSSTFRILGIKEEPADEYEEEPIGVAAETQQLFETIPIKQEPLEDEADYQGPSHSNNFVPTDSEFEQEMKPIIAEPPAKKRRATLTKEPEETTPAAETPKGRRKSAPSVPEPEDAPEQAPEPEASGVESRRASRRSTAGFKDFMAQVRGPTRKDSQEKTATEEKKKRRSRKVKEPTPEPEETEEEAEEEAADPNSKDKSLPPLPLEVSPLMIDEAEQDDNPEEEEEPVKKTTPKIKLPIRKRASKKEKTPESPPEPPPKDFSREKEPSESPTPTPSPAAARRRSSRGSVPSSKIVEMKKATPRGGGKAKEEKEKEKAPEKFSLKPKPGSALEILKKTSRYQRVQRSPTPEATLTPSPAASASSSTHITPEKKQEKVVEEPKKEEKESPVVKKKEEVEKEEAEKVKSPEKPSEQVEDEPMEVEEPEEVKPEKEKSAEELQPSTSTANAPEVSEDEPEPEEDDEESEPEPEPAKNSKSKRQPLKGLIKITPKGRKAVTALKSLEKAVPKTPEKVATTPVEDFVKPAPIVTARRSGRALKPKVVSDYVFEGPVTIRKDVETPRSPLKSPLRSTPVKSPTAIKSLPLKSPPVKSPSVKSPPVKSLEKPETSRRKSVSQTPEKKAEKPAEPAPEDGEETAAEKTRKYVEEHKGPIKLSFKIGEDVATVLKPTDESAGTSASTPVSEDSPLEEETGDETIMSTEDIPQKMPHLTGAAAKSHKKKDPHWWTSYTPSPKPILENFIRPDGTIEHLGVVVNSVMDHLLLKVCEDGIKRHSNNRGKEARKQEIAEMAKKRYHDKKKLAEERMARGEPAELFPAKRTTAELFAHTIATRERAKKGALYRSNEYLLKPSKYPREMEMEVDEAPQITTTGIRKREQREQEARDYLNRQFMREAEEDLRNEKRDMRMHKKASKPIKHVTFKDFLDEKSEKTAQALRPSQANGDYFHREILREPEEIYPPSQSSEVDTDDDEAPLTATTSANFMEHAQSSTDQICTYMMRRLNPDGGCNIYDMLERVREEPEIRQAVIANTIEVLIEFHQVQLGVEYSTTAHITLHNEAQRRAYDLRSAFSINNSERETMAWAHSLLIQNLPADYLSGYLILLRYWKHQSGSVVASFAKKSQDESYPWPEVTDIIWSYITGKVLDPDRENLQATINAESLSDVIFVLVPPAFQFGEYTYTTKAHDTIYRWLKGISSKESFIVNMEYECRNNESIWEAVDFYVKVIKNEVQKLVKEMRDKRIVLVGWRLSSYFNHRVVQLIHGVSAIIDLAFNQKTQYGYRGGPDDDILLTYCPSLFVVGSHSTSFDAVKLKELRGSMQSETGAIVVHYGDDHLYVPTYVLNRLGITQRTVYRSIIETIIEFLNLPSTKKERSQLIQVDLNSVYNVDLDSMKAIAGGAPAALRLVQKYPSADGKPLPTPRPRKRKMEFITQPPTLMTSMGGGLPPPAVSSLLAESNVVTTAEARYRFDEIVRNARSIGHADLSSPQSPSLPRTAPAMYKGLVSPKIMNPLLRPPPLPSQLLAQPAPPPPASRGPLDPANISLS